MFIAVPKTLEASLRAAGARYYVRSSESLPPGLAMSDKLLLRLVTSFATAADEVDRFVELAAKP